MIYQNLTELIGKTPVVKLNKLFKYNNVYAKLEKYNISGSVKDRAVYQILIDLLINKKIDKGWTIIEATSGNTGISIACLSNYFSLKSIIVMPKTASVQRRELIKAYGGELILVDGGINECKIRAQELNQQIKTSIILNQFENHKNVEAHYINTAKEIEKDLPNVDVIICGIGSGGTITGISKYFKYKDVEIIGVEPKESPLLSKGKYAPHKIQGIGPNIIPKILDLSNVSKIKVISYEDSRKSCEILKLVEGYLVGLSSGAVLEVCQQLLEEKIYEKKNILLIFPDGGERYSWN